MPDNVPKPKALEWAESYKKSREGRPKVKITPGTIYSPGRNSTSNQGSYTFLVDDNGNLSIEREDDGNDTDILIEHQVITELIRFLEDNYRERASYNAREELIE